MKNLLLIPAFLVVSTCMFAQLKTTTVCPTIVVDILDGKVNGVDPEFTPDQIKQKLPCFTAIEPENGDSKCGGTITYKDKDMYFHTGRDYVEIKEKFKGKLTIPLMGAGRNALFKWLGHPKIKEQSWDAYQTQYGTLVLYYNKANKINRIIFSKKSTETLTLCE
jgi:hypothetical protein